jgi:choline transport protein
MSANAAMLGFPALVLLVTDGKLLPANNHWNYGVFSKPIYVVSVGYSILVVIVSAVCASLRSKATNSQDTQLPQSHPVTSLNMNYTVLVMGGFSIVMGLAWVTEGRKLFKPPVNDESLVKTNDVIIGVNVDLEADEQASKGKDAAGSSGHDKNQSLIVTEA